MLSLTFPVMRHDSKIQLNNSVSLLFRMFCSHDQAFKKYQKKLLHCNYLMFFLVCQNCERKKMLSNTCNELTFISYFGKCEYDYCFNMLQEHDNNTFKEFSRFFICSRLDYLLQFIRSKSG